MRAVALAALLLASPADAACRQALALGLDISGSVDAQEYRLQLDGLAEALASAPVRAALFAMPDAPVEITVYEWSGPGDFRLTAPWTTIAAPADLDALLAVLRGARRPAATPSTAIGSAMRAGAGLLAGRSCWRKVLDLSGDGPSNTGPRPREIRRALSDVVVNALVVGSGNRTRDDRLVAYFEAEVIAGPDAFAERARDFSDYSRAMERKLLRELQVVMLGAR